MIAFVRDTTNSLKVWFFGNIYVNGLESGCLEFAISRALTI